MGILMLCMRRYSLHFYGNIEKFIRELHRLTTCVNKWTSDPGTTAELTPFCETYGLYFSPEHEPESMQYTLDKDIINTLVIDEDAYNITPGLEGPEEYYDMLVKTSEMTKKIKFEDEYDDSNAYVIDINIDTDI